MQVNVRLSGEMAKVAGRARFGINLEEGATVGDLLTALQQEYPGLWPRMDSAVPIISGKHVTQAEPVSSGQEVAFLLPIAGG